MAKFTSAVKLFFQGDRLLAIATNVSWKNGVNDESATRYFCLKGVWEEDDKTMIVSESELEQLSKGKRLMEIRGIM